MDRSHVQLLVQCQELVAFATPDCLPLYLIQAVLSTRLCTTRVFLLHHLAPAITSQTLPSYEIFNRQSHATLAIVFSHHANLVVFSAQS
jgi:hypothetical protein